MSALANWVDPRHLSETALDRMASMFAGSGHASLVLDDFLLPRRLVQLRRLFSEDGCFEAQHFQRGEGLGQQERKLSLDQWNILEEPLRASIEGIFVGPRPDRQLGEGLLAHLKFQEMLSSAQFLAVLKRISRVDLRGFIPMPPRILSRGHFIKPHSDAAPGRRLCAVFYVSDGWRSGFGGEFRQMVPGQAPLTIDPLPNRLLLFRPDPDNLHEVLPLTAIARAWCRWAYTFWFGEAA